MINSFTVKKDLLDKWKKTIGLKYELLFKYNNISDKFLFEINNKTTREIICYNLKEGLFNNIPVEVIDRTTEKIIDEGKIYLRVKYKEKEFDFNEFFKMLENKIEFDTKIIK